MPSIFDPPLYVTILTAVPLAPVLLGMLVGTAITAVKRFVRDGWT